MKHNRIQGLSSGIVDVFLIPLITIALLGSLSLILPNFKMMSPTAVKITTGLLFVIILFAVCQPLRRLTIQVYTRLYRYRRILIWVILVVTLCWQIAIVYLLSGPNAYDTRMIMSAVINGVAPNQDYFSAYPNTILMFFLERALWLITGRPVLETFVIYQNIVNLFLIDCGALMLFNSVRRLFGKKHVQLLFFITWLVILISPWVAVPYTDTWAFFLTALFLNMGTTYFSTSNHVYRYLLAGLTGVGLVFAYLMKPSLVITFIAFGIVGLFRGIGRNWFQIKKVAIFSVLLFVIGAGGSFWTHQIFLDHQNVLDNNTKLAHPMSHYIPIGMHVKGAYNPLDTKMDSKIKSPAKRKQANAKLIRQRLHDFNGMTNYEKFLVNKQVNNISDGTYSWGGDVLIKTNYANSTIRNKTLIRRLFAKQGYVRPNTFEYRFVAQLVWSVCLLLVLFTINVKNWRVQFFKYGVVGFMLFLLIFEGGRSRYVIQFLPLVLALATVGGMRLLTYIRCHHISTQKSEEK